MIRRAARPEAHFVMIRNDVARDERLSYRARGILIDILSRPDNWRINRDQLARRGKEGVAAVRTALKELEDFGYLTRRRVKDPVTGKFGWDSIVYDTPQIAKPQVTPIGGFPADGFPADGNQPSIEDPHEDVHEDVLEWPAPPSSERRVEYQDWRTEDRELFRTVVGDTMTSDGTIWKPAGAYSADTWYDALRRNPSKPMKWPGKYVASVADRDGLYEFFGAFGLEPAA